MCYGDLCGCGCVSRAISGVGFALFLFTTFCFFFSLTFCYALFTVHVSCIWLGKFPVCLHDVCCRWFGGGGRDGD